MKSPAAAHEDALRSLVGHGRQELLTAALSEFLGGSGSQRIIETTFLVTAARLYVGAPVYADGRELPPHVENPPALTPASGDAALKRLGIERDELTQRWRAEQRRWRGKAVLPTDWLIEFFPVPAWGYLDALVHDGPDVAVHRLHAALEWEGERRLPGSRIREEGSRPAVGYLVNLQSACRRFMPILSVRARAAESPAELSHWALPLRPSPLITTGRRKVTRRAPTLPLVRQVWAIHRDYVLERAGATCLNDLPAAIALATGRRIPRDRPETLSRLRHPDPVRDHRWTPGSDPPASCR